MLNCERLEKSKGAIIFANNTREFDYVKIAEYNAKLIERYLGIPTTILSVDKETNQRLDVTTGKFIEWKNRGRSHAYDLSPYDETLLLDADYLMLDDSLTKLFDTNQPYILFDKNRYITDMDLRETMGKYSLPFVWATAIMFRRDPKTKSLFDLVKMIENNYFYYRSLYNIQESNYRNDYAFAIAHHILNGYQRSEEQLAPFHILTVPGIIEKMEMRESQIIVRTESKSYVLPKQSIHILSKHYLHTDDFQKFIEDVLA